MGFQVFMFSCFWVLGFFLDAKKVQKKLNENCSSKKNCSALRRKKHENMKTQKPPKIDAKTQKPIVYNSLYSVLAVSVRLVNT